MDVGSQEAMTTAGAGLIRPFVVVDRIGAMGGIGIVVIANGLIIREPAVWLILPFLFATVAALTFAKRSVDSGQVRTSLIAITLGNWLIGVAVAVMFPFLWPAMVFTVIMPLMLATPYIDADELPVWIAATAFLGGVVAIAGLVNDGGGAVTDIDDTAELLIVTAALVGHMVPMALIVLQHRRLQAGVLEEAQQLNRELRVSQAALEESRRRVVEAGDRERSRIERDLHDGAQQRLIAAKLQTQMLAERVDDSTRPTVERIAAELAGAVSELRELAQGIYPPMLEASGLADALGVAVRRAPSSVTLEASGIGRYSQPVESALYFTALEAITNSTKHAADATTTVQLRDTADGDGTRHVTLIVADDGPGFAPERGASAQDSATGLLGMSDRVTAAGGRLGITTRPGEGVTVTATIPIDHTR